MTSLCPKGGDTDADGHSDSLMDLISIDLDSMSKDPKLIEDLPLQWGDVIELNPLNLQSVEEGASPTAMPKAIADLLENQIIYKYG